MAHKRRRVTIALLAATALALIFLLQPVLHWTGAAPLPIDVEIRDATSGAALPGVQLTLVIDGAPVPANVLTPQATTGADGKARLVGMLSAGGTRGWFASSGGIGSDAGAVRCDLPRYQSVELKLPRVKTLRILGIGRDPRVRLKVAMQPGR